MFASSRLSHRAIRGKWVRTLNSIIYVSLQWTRRRSERTMKQCRREKRSFLHTLILGNKKQTSPKKYRTLISLILLGHMQKISHFWAKMKKDPKCQLGRFCPEPFNYPYLKMEVHVISTIPTTMLIWTVLWQQNKVTSIRIEVLKRTVTKNSISLHNQ